MSQRKSSAEENRELLSAKIPLRLRSFLISILTSTPGRRGAKMAEDVKRFLRASFSRAKQVLSVYFRNVLPCSFRL